MMENKKVTAKEESTTPIVEKQSPNNTKTSLPENKIIFNGRKIEKLETIDSKTLLETELPPIYFIIENILPQGLFILAGSPKVGKSWLSLDLCHTVASGSQIWNLNSTEGKVLYLALEDSLVRLQTRLNKITDEGCLNLFFAVRALKIQDGLIAQIDNFINQYPDTNLIIIDTMQHIRNNANDKNAYVSDYNDMNVLRQITNKYKVALILVTHTRKMDDPDPLNIISGSTGLVGAVDGVFILEKNKRTENLGKLTITNRDTESYVFILEFEKDICRWQFVEEETNNESEEPLYIFLSEFMKDKTSWSGTATELCDKYSECYSKKYIPATISKKIKAGQKILKDKYSLKCYFKIEKNTKLIKISKEI